MNSPVKTGETVVEIPVERLIRSYFQPRELFEPEKMRATRNSIRDKGQKIPVVVRAILQDNRLFDQNWTEIHYEIADGERRTRCIRDLGLKTVKAVIRDLADEDMLDLTLTTNDSVPLNPIERSRVFFRLAQEFGKTQAEIAQSYNLKQQQVSEYVRLLELPNEIQDLTARAVLTIRHARELLKVSNNEMRLKLGKRAVEERLSTRDLTDLVRKHQGPLRKSENDVKIRHNDIDFTKDLVLNTISDSGVNFAEREALVSQIETVRSAEGLAKRLLRSLLDFFGQLNGLFLFGKMGRQLRNHMQKNPLLKKLRPESYLALVELCIFLPTILIYGLFQVYPVAIIGLAALLSAAVCLRFLENWLK